MASKGVSAARIKIRRRFFCRFWLGVSGFAEVLLREFKLFARELEQTVALLIAFPYVAPCY